MKLQNSVLLFIQTYKAERRDVVCWWVTAHGNPCSSGSSTQVHASSPPSFKEVLRTLKLSGNTWSRAHLTFASEIEISPDHSFLFTYLGAVLNGLFFPRSAFFTVKKRAYKICLLSDKRLTDIMVHTWNHGSLTTSTSTLTTCMHAPSLTHSNTHSQLQHIQTHNTH